MSNWMKQVGIALLAIIGMGLLMVLWFDSNWSKDEGESVVQYQNENIFSPQFLSRIFTRVFNTSKAAPTLKVTISPEAAYLKWKKANPQQKFSGYEIYRNGQMIKRVTQTKYRDTDLILGINYTYYIKAYDDLGRHTNSSNLVKIVIRLKNNEFLYGIKDSNSNIFHNTVTEPEKIYKAPKAPKRLKGKYEAKKGVLLTWVKNNASNISGYYIYRNQKRIKTVRKRVVKYWDRRVRANRSYQYYIEAFDQRRQKSKRSNRITVKCLVKKDPLAGMTLAEKNKYFETKLQATIGVELTEKTNNSVVFQWSSKKKLAKVKKVEIYRNGGLAGVVNPATNIFEDVNLAPGKKYEYWLKAFNRAGELIEKSEKLTFSTLENFVTIYYANAKNENIYICYQQNDQWLAEPGLLMNQSEIEGYSKLRLNMRDAAAVEAFFSKGQGHKDDAQGTNYRLTPGTVTIFNHKIVSGVPKPANKVTIYYKKGFSKPHLFYELNGVWLENPGLPMEESEFANYNKITINMGSQTELKAYFTDGNIHKDDNQGANYAFMPGVYTFDNGEVNIGAP